MLRAWPWVTHVLHGKAWTSPPAKGCVATTPPLFHEDSHTSPHITSPHLHSPHRTSTQRSLGTSRPHISLSTGVIAGAPQAHHCPCPEPGPPFSSHPKPRHHLLNFLFQQMSTLAKPEN